MPENLHPEPTAIPAAETQLLAGTERRINRGMLAVGLAGTIVCLAWGGMSWAAGFAVGAALSALNFRWMKMAAHALADAATGQSQGAQPGSGRGVGVAARFVFRYALIGLVAYAIFISSFVSLGAFFAGLFVFIGAILAEVAYQIYAAFRSS